MGKSKIYGKPYERRELLKRGDIKKISEKTGLAYQTVVQQLNGQRALKPLVKEVADSLANATENQIKLINTKNY